MLLPMKEENDRNITIFNSHGDKLINDEKILISLLRMTTTCLYVLA